MIKTSVKKLNQNEIEVYIKNTSTKDLIFDANRLSVYLPISILKVNRVLVTRGIPYKFKMITYKGSYNQLKYDRTITLKPNNEICVRKINMLECYNTSITNIAMQVKTFVTLVNWKEVGCKSCILYLKSPIYYFYRTKKKSIWQKLVLKLHKYMFK